MQKALIHYFSGTGNSLLAAKQLAQELAGFDYDIVFHCIEDGLYDRSEVYSLHIFFFPVYATGVPHIMGKYIRRLPDGKKARTAVISTNGKISTRYRDGYQGWALHQARLYLKLKNYDVVFSDTLDYPHNVTVFFPPRNESSNQVIITQAAENTTKMAQRIAGKQTYHRSCFYPNFIWSVPFSILFSLAGRRFLGKMYAADSSCNHCKLCMQQCPVKAINADHKVIRWRTNCEGCLRCINICPKKSIQLSALRAALVTCAVVANPLLLLYRYIPDQFMNSLGAVSAVVFNVLLYVFMVLMFMYLMDRLLNLLSFIPVCRKIIGFGHTKFFGRYHAKRFEDIFLKK